MTSAWSITAAVNPPRAAFLDFPLGHTAGRPDESHEQTSIMRAALKVFSDAPRGSITRLPYQWEASEQANDEWKAAVMAGDAGPTADGPTVDGPTPDGKESLDDRIERFDTPQYQSDDDARSADAACPTCVWL